MSELERAEAAKEIQLELFQLKQDQAERTREYLAKRKALKRKLRLIHGKGLKRCRRCNYEMPVEQFSLDRQKTDGRSSYCLECISERYKLRRKGNVLARGVAA